jgi:hypothetical protein
VTPPHFTAVSLTTTETPLGAHRADWLVLHLLFYAYFPFKARLPMIALQDAVKDGVRKGDGMVKQVV